MYLEEKFQELKKLPLYYEECERNLHKEDKHNKYALDLQLEFLGHRFDNERCRAIHKDKTLILDRCIFEDYHIFAKVQLELGYLNKNDLAEYLKVYCRLLEEVEAPSVFVYLRTSTPVLLERIHRRGRDFEQSIDSDYLERITKHYDLLFDNLAAVMPKTQLIVCDTDNKGKSEVLEYVFQELSKLGIE